MSAEKLISMDHITLEQLKMDLCSRITEEEWAQLHKSGCPLCISESNRRTVLRLRNLQPACEETVPLNSIRELETDLENYLHTYMADRPEGHKWIIIACLQLTFLEPLPMHPQEAARWQKRGDAYYCPACQKDTVSCGYCVCRPGRIVERPSGPEVVKSIDVVAAVIVEGSRIFATERGYGPYKDWWEFPGGKIEPGETPRQALVREIREELDTDIEVGDHIITVEHDYPEYHVVLQCYWAHVVEGSLVLKEHEAARWVSLDELDSLRWLGADYPVLEKIRAELDTCH